MSFPNTRMLPSGTKLRILREQERRSLGGRQLEPVLANTIVTVNYDFGGGKISVRVPNLCISGIVHLWDGDAEIIG